MRDWNTFKDGVKLVDNTWTTRVNRGRVDIFNDLFLIF